jgi:glycosyltransferase involved in cell wall biosynthesis
LKRRFESRLLNEAACAIAVSRLCAESLQQNFHPPYRPEVVTNGFDPEELALADPRRFDDVALVYAGSFQAGSRDAGPLIDMVVRANTLRDAAAPPIRLHYFGSYGRYIGEAAASRDARSLVFNHGVVPRCEVFAALKGAAAAAVVTTIHDSGSLAELGILTGKLFEALGSGTRLLLIAPHGSEAAEIVAETRSGAHFRGSQVKEGAAWLARLGALPYQPNKQRIDAYAWPTLAGKLDQVLRRCLQR